MDPQTPDPANAGATGHHEGADRCHHVDRSGSDGRGGPRWTFRAPVAVRPDDIASAIADVVARAVVGRSFYPIAKARLAQYGTAADDLAYLEGLYGTEFGAFLDAINRTIAYGPVPDPSTSPDLSPSPDMAAPADLPSATDVSATPEHPAAEPVRPSRAAHRDRSVQVAR